MSALYADAAAVLRLMDEKSLGLKTALYHFQEERQTSHLRKVYALVAGVAEKKRSLTELIEGSKLASPPGNHIKNWHLALVLVYEMIYSPHPVGGGGAAIRALKGREQSIRSLHSAIEERNISSGVVSMKRKASDTTGPVISMKDIPRYARINRLKADMNWQSIKKSLEKSFTNEKVDVVVTVDPLVPSLLVVPARAAAILSQHPLVQSGTLVIQDRSSCLAALAADIRPGDTILEPCAAPGSKTLQILDYLQNDGYIVACEKSLKRAAILILRLLQAGNLDGPVNNLRNAAEASLCPPIFESDVKSEDIIRRINQENLSKLFFYSKNSEHLVVEVRIGDFLSMEPSSFPPIKTIVLDPSCSGSGLPTHNMEATAGTTKNEYDSRLKALSSLQKKMLRRCIRDFPSVSTVCYSTCSLHQEENEKVVSACLKASAGREEYFRRRVRLVTAVPWFPRDAAEKTCPLLKCVPHVHHCRGFFLAKMQIENL